MAVFLDAAPVTGRETVGGAVGPQLVGMLSVEVVVPLGIVLVVVE